MAIWQWQKRLTQYPKKLYSALGPKRASLQIRPLSRFLVFNLLLPASVVRCSTMSPKGDKLMDACLKAIRESQTNIEHVETGMNKLKRKWKDVDLSLKQLKEMPREETFGNEEVQGDREVSVSPKIIYLSGLISERSHLSSQRKGERSKNSLFKMNSSTMTSSEPRGNSKRPKMLSKTTWKQQSVHRNGLTSCKT